MSEQTATAEPQIIDGETELTVIRKTKLPLRKIWDALLTDAGSESLLGKGGKFADKGYDWEAEDGTHGVTRSFHPMEQIRFSWHADPDAPATLVDMRLSEAEDGAELKVVHQRLYDGIDREKLARHWATALERLDDHVTD